MAGKHKGATSDVRRVAAAERRARLLALRKTGATYRDIAQAEGISPGGAFKAVQQAIRDIPKEAADEMRVIEQQRLDNMHAAIWERALHGDIQAISTVLSIMQARARLLGLNIDAQSAPARTVQKAYLCIDLDML